MAQARSARVLAVLAATGLSTVLAGCASKPTGIMRTAHKSEHECMARAMYFESNRSSDEGMLAVGTVVANRVSSPMYPKTVCGVVGQPNQFAPGVLTRSMTEDASAARARRVAGMVLSGKRHRGVKTAMFFHTHGYKFPYRNMAYVLVAGGNAFYEKRKPGTFRPGVPAPVMVASLDQVITSGSAIGSHVAPETGPTPAPTVAAAPAPVMVAAVAPAPRPAIVERPVRETPIVVASLDAPVYQPRRAPVERPQPPAVAEPIPSQRETIAAAPLPPLEQPAYRPVERAAAQPDRPTKPVRTARIVEPVYASSIGGGSAEPRRESGPIYRFQVGPSGSSRPASNGEASASTGGGLIGESNAGGAMEMGFR